MFSGGFGLDGPDDCADAVRLASGAAVFRCGSLCKAKKKQAAKTMVQIIQIRFLMVREEFGSLLKPVENRGD